MPFMGEIRMTNETGMRGENRLNLASQVSGAAAGIGVAHTPHWH